MSVNLESLKNKAEPKPSKPHVHSAVMSKPKNYEMRSPTEKEYDLNTSSMYDGRNSMGHYLPNEHSINFLAETNIRSASKQKIFTLDKEELIPSAGTLYLNFIDEQKRMILSKNRSLNKTMCKFSIEYALPAEWWRKW